MILKLADLMRSYDINLREPCILGKSAYTLKQKEIMEFAIYDAGLQTHLQNTKLRIHRWSQGYRQVSTALRSNVIRSIN